MVELAYELKRVVQGPSVREMSTGSQLLGIYVFDGRLLNVAYQIVYISESQLRNMRTYSSSGHILNGLGKSGHTRDWPEDTRFILSRGPSVT